MKSAVQVEIAGQKLSIRSDEGQAYVEELAEYVDGQLRELVAARRNASNVQRLALLVALQLADELFRERDLHRRFRERVSAKLKALAQAMDEHESRLQSL